LRPIDWIARALSLAVSIQSDLTNTSIFSWLAAVQIRFILLQNRQGKTRLAKYYVPLEDSEKHKVEYEVRDGWIGAAFGQDLDSVFAFLDSVSCWPAGAPAGRQSGPEVHQFRRGNPGSWIFAISSQNTSQLLKIWEVDQLQILGFTMGRN
jgi:hypothetical protein